MRNARRLKMADVTETPIPTQADIQDAVLKIFYRHEISALPERPFRDFVFMVSRRLAKDGPPPTSDELEGLKELAFDELWHPAFNRLRPYYEANVDDNTTAVSATPRDPKSEPPSC